MPAKERDLLKVDIVSPYPLKKNSPDGVARYAIESVPYLRDKGCEVVLIGPENGNKSDNVANHKLGRTISVSHDNTQHESAFSFNKGLAKAIILTSRPDIINFQEPLAGHQAHTVISAAPKREDGSLLPSCIATFHGRLEKIGFKTQFLLTLGRILRRPKFDLFIPTGFTKGYINTIMENLDGRSAVSGDTASFWNDLYPGDYEVINNGIDTQELTPYGPKMEQWQKDGKKTILFAGRHDTRKGIDDLLNAYLQLCRKRNDLKLKITGKGQETENLLALAHSLNLPDVEFTGVLSRDELIKAYRSADVFVSPATGGEGFGRTLAEALSCGTPVVGTNIGGYREVIGGKSFARMVKPRNTAGLAVAISSLLDLPVEKRRELSMEANKYVRENFAWPIIAGKMVVLFEKSLAKHGKPAPSDWPKKDRGVIGELRKITGLLFEES